MDIHHRICRTQFWKTFWNRKSELSKNSLLLLQKKYRAGILVFLALIFAITAYRVTGKEAQSDWLLSHKPDFGTWEDYLNRKGYVRVLDGEIIEKVLKSKTLSEISALLENSEIGKKGIEELKKFHTYLDPLGTDNEVQFDITLARGLNYYTGCIFEVAAKDTPMGSIGGGGRYDNLTGVFGLQGVSDRLTGGRPDRQNTLLHYRRWYRSEWAHEWFRPSLRHLAQGKFLALHP